jgi:hypothetical protein
MNSFRWFPRASIIAGILLAAGCGLHPIHNRTFQAGFFAGVALLWWGVASFPPAGWKRRVFIALPMMVLFPFLLPGKSMDRVSLREDYVRRMRGFLETRYLWGGESPLGIDCSGLPRRALRDALWAEGWKHANGTAFRMWLDQWWYDSSARAMGMGYRGRTRSLDAAGPLWKLDQNPIQPGDLAIREDGVHVVVYLGNHQWIEADPGRGKVRAWTPLPTDGPWYEPMTLHRWAVLDNGTK